MFLYVAKNNGAMSECCMVLYEGIHSPRSVGKIIYVSYSVFYECNYYSMSQKLWWTPTL